jgi:hypothetical protein
VLREAAVIAVGVDAEGGAALDALASLRKLIDELPPLRRRRDEHPEALLPRISEAVASADDEDDEEEEYLELLP